MVTTLIETEGVRRKDINEIKRLVPRESPSGWLPAIVIRLDRCGAV